MMNVFARRSREKVIQTPDGKFAAGLDRLRLTLVLDVGANVGQTGLRLRHLGYGGRIVSFEPVPEAYETLLTTAVDDPDWYVASRIALGATVGVLDFHIAVASDLSSGLEPSPELLDLLPDSRVLKTRRIAQTTIEEAVRAFAQDDDRILLKVDVQGMEDQVLDGVGAAWPRITAVALKMSLFPLYRGEKTIGHLMQRLAGLGFEPWLLTECHYASTLARQVRVDGLFARAE